MDGGAGLDLNEKVFVKVEYNSCLEDADSNACDPLASGDDEEKGEPNNEKYEPGGDLGTIELSNTITDPHQELGHLKVGKKRPKKYRHIRRAVYACSECEYVSNQKSHFDIHMRSHTGAKPFPCNLCNHSAKDLGSLKVHVRTHTGDKPYACTICDFKSIQFSNMKRHMNVHNGVRPFFCELCDFRSGMLHQLKNHMRRHTGEKPYACDVCDFKTAHCTTLKKHKKRHVEGKPSSAPEETQPT